MKKELFVVRPVHGYRPGYPKLRTRRRFMLVARPVLLFGITVTVLFMFAACGQNEGKNDASVKYVGVTQLAESGDVDDLLSDNGPPVADELLAEDDIVGGDDLLSDDGPVAADDLLDVDEVLAPDEFEDMELPDAYDDYPVWDDDGPAGVAPTDDTGMTDDDYVEEPDYDDYWMNQLGGAPPPGCGCAVVE